MRSRVPRASFSMPFSTRVGSLYSINFVGQIDGAPNAIRKLSAGRWAESSAISAILGAIVDSHVGMRPNTTVAEMKFASTSDGMLSRIHFSCS